MTIYRQHLQVFLYCFLLNLEVKGSFIKLNRPSPNEEVTPVKPVEVRMPKFGGNSTGNGLKYVRLSSSPSNEDPFDSVTKSTTCGTTYVLENGHMAMIYSRHDFYSYTCMNTFKAAGDSSVLILDCPNFRLRFSCYFESLKIIVDGEEQEYCGRDSVPRISSKEIKISYKRVLMGFNGGYNCIMAAVGPGQPTVNTTGLDCGVALERDTSHHRIVGGIEAKIGHPWMVYLEISVSSYGKGNDKYRCGGSLITPKDIVTAAHCLIDAIFIDVGFGRHDLSLASEPGSVTKRTVKYKIHESYDGDLILHDIAIVSLDEPISYSNVIFPICLPAADLEPQDGKQSVATGWGTTSYGGSISAVLQEVNLTIQHNRQCQSDWQIKMNDPTFEIFDTQVCTKNQGKDTCSGDSGGPLMIQENNQWTLFGITSYGYRCADPHVGGVYTRVSEYINWINSHIEHHSNS